MSTILLIEDELDLREVLAYNLRQAGHEVTLAGRAGEGLRLCRERPPDLVILDLMLPDRPGTEVCRAIRAGRATAAVPILALTARAEELDRVHAFELGVDDYVTKPFSMRELLLRVQALLRRTAPRASGGDEVIVFGRLRVDRAAHRVWVDGGEVELTALELKILTFLYDRKDRVQARDAMVEAVWGLDSEVTPRTVDTHVKRLRDKLGAAAAYVETVRGVGYRFAGRPGEAPTA